MSRVSVSQADYGVIGAGALSKSLIGQLPRKSRQIGLVAGISFRVASRMANSLRAGHATRSADDLNHAPVILFHAPDDQIPAVTGLLEQARIDWRDKPLLFCDCDVPAAVAARLRGRGASIAVARQFGISGAIMVEGDPAALAAAHRLALDLRLRAIEIAPGAAGLFAAARTLATAALTPLVNRAANMLRASGLRDKDAVLMATALFGRTIQEYGHSGRQSWVWHVREPDVDRIQAEIAIVEEPFRELFRDLILTGFEDFEKHPKAAKALRDASVAAREHP